MNNSDENNFKRIADALDRLSPAPPNIIDLNSSNLFLWKTKPDRLVLIKNDYLLNLDMLIGVNYNKQKLYKNTLQFAKGFSANNVLLWGARGTGKSSLIKLIHNQISAEYNSLKLIQMQREDISSIELYATTLVSPSALSIGPLGLTATFRLRTPSVPHASYGIRSFISST